MEDAAKYCSHEVIDGNRLFRRAVLVGGMFDRKIPKAGTADRPERRDDLSHKPGLRPELSIVKELGGERADGPMQPPVSSRDNSLVGGIVCSSPRI
jgi:hypothetical protein